MNAAVVYSAAAFCFTVEGGDELPDTARTNSSREQLPVTKKAVGCVRDSYEEGGML